MLASKAIPVVGISVVALVVALVVAPFVGGFIAMIFPTVAEVKMDSAPIMAALPATGTFTAASGLIVRWEEVGQFCDIKSGTFSHRTPGMCTPRNIFNALMSVVQTSKLSPDVKQALIEFLTDLSKTYGL